VTPIYVLGAGGHGRVVLDILRRGGTPADGVFDDQRTAPLEGTRILGPFAAALDRPGAGIVVALGDMALRRRWAAAVEAAGLSLIRAVHPDAIIAHSAQIGAGSVICAGAVIGPGATVGRHAIVNTLASVDHDCTVGDNAHVAPGVRLCGHVRVGADALVGAGAILLPGATVADGTTVPAGHVLRA